MREAMIALSQGRTRQLLRGIIDLGEGKTFGVMPGASLDEGPFGAKLVSVFPGNVAARRMSHQGVVVLFDPDTGAPTAVIDAGEMTAIRTAAATAAATDALARPDAAPARDPRHRRAGAPPRRRDPPGPADQPGHDLGPRSAEKAAALAAAACGGSSRGTVAEAVGRDADIICTTTARSRADPAQRRRAGRRPSSTWSAPAAPARPRSTSRWSRASASSPIIATGVLAQGAEFLRARAAGLIDDEPCGRRDRRGLRRHARGPRARGPRHRLQVARQASSRTSPPPRSCSAPRAPPPAAPPARRA